jgi:Bacterial-like globin
MLMNKLTIALGFSSAMVALTACGGDGGSTTGTGGSSTTSSTTGGDSTTTGSTTTGSTTTGSTTTGSTSSGSTTTGGGSAACSQDMYAKYKDAGFTAVNTKIIENTVKISAMNPSPIGDTFKPIIADKMKAATFTTNLAAFLIQAYGGPKNYKGKAMVAAHTGLKITQAQYDYFIANAVVPALKDAGVNMKDITDCFAPVVTDPAFVKTIVGL